MIDRVIESININGRIILILNGNHVLKSKEIIEEINKLKDKYGKVEIIESFSKLEGAAKTALEARELLKAETELIIAYCDQIMEWNPDTFLKYRQANNYDGLLATYNNNEPKDDFLLCDNNNNVIQLIPKKAVSNIATIGLYYWRRTDIFLNGVDTMIKKGIRYNGEFYIGPVFNENISEGYKIGYLNTGVEQVGNPEDFKKYINKLGTFYLH